MLIQKKILQFWKKIVVNIKTYKHVLGFAAYSGTGKTTLLKNIIPLLKNKNYKVGIIKHAHHAFDVDQKGKDSYELRKAGASHMLITSNQRWALMVENTINKEPNVDEYIKKFDHEDLDLILVEGFKAQDIPKIELHRPILGHPLLCTNDKNIIAIAIDSKLNEDINIPILDLNNYKMIVEFIINNFSKNNSNK